MNNQECTIKISKKLRDKLKLLVAKHKYKNYDTLLTKMAVACGDNH